MYSPPLSILMDFIFFLELFSIKALKTLKMPNTYDFCFMKYTQKNLEQSSIKVRKYLEPLIDFVGIGPETSLCIRSSIEVALVSYPSLHLFSICLPTNKPRHAPSDVWMTSKPSMIFSL